MSKVKGNVIDPLDLVYGADFKDVVAEDASRRARGRGAREVQEGVPVGGADGGGVPRVRRGRASLHARDLPADQQAHRPRAEAHRGEPPLPEQDLERDAVVARAPRRLRIREAAERLERERIRTTAGSSRASRAARRGRNAGLRGVPDRRGGQRALPLLLERLLRLVPRDREASPARRGRPLARSSRETNATLAHVLETPLSARSTRSCRT